MRNDQCRTNVIGHFKRPHWFCKLPHHWRCSLLVNCRMWKMKKWSLASSKSKKYCTISIRKTCTYIAYNYTRIRSCNIYTKFVSDGLCNPIYLCLLWLHLRISRSRMSSKIKSSGAQWRKRKAEKAKDCKLRKLLENYVKKVARVQSQQCNPEISESVAVLQFLSKCDPVINRHLVHCHSNPWLVSPSHDIQNEFIGGWKSMQ